jgi:hypothetical protein
MPNTETLKPDGQRVLSAIDGGYRTFVSLTIQLNVPPHDLDLLLAGMISDRLIRKESKGDLDAYFRFEQKPVRFWRSGGGRVDAEFDTDFVPRDETAKAEEMSKFYIKSDGEQEAAKSAETPRSTGQNGASSEVAKEAPTASVKAPGEKNIKTGRPPKFHFTVEFFHQQGLLGRSHAEIAQSIGMDASTITYHLSKPDFRWAYELGKGERKRSNEEPESTKAMILSDLKMLGLNGHAEPLYEIAEGLGYNLGNALIHVAADEVEAAIWYLEREKTRRERQAAIV